MSRVVVSVWLCSDYARVFLILSVVVVALPLLMMRVEGEAHEL